MFKERYSKIFTNGVRNRTTAGLQYAEGRYEVLNSSSQEVCSFINSCNKYVLNDYVLISGSGISAVNNTVKMSAPIALTI